MKYAILIGVISCSLVHSTEDENAVKNREMENEILKIVDRLTPQQQKQVIEFVESDEMERFVKEFIKTKKKLKRKDA